MGRIDRVTDPELGALLAPAPLDAELEALLPRESESWAISLPLARLLVKLVLRRDAGRVLEFGAGLSSLLFAHALARRGGGCLTSVEQMPEWCADRWREVERVAGVDARLVAAQPRLRASRHGFHHTLPAAREALAERGPFDLLLIDAPQSFYGRAGVLHLAIPHLAPGALVVLDDAGRGGERWSLRHWLRTYPGLTLAVYDPDFGQRGVAVLRLDGPAGARADARGFAASALRSVRYWNRRRRRRGAGGDGAV